MIISEDILRIIDYNTCHNEEKALVISALEHNGSEKLDELRALIDCTGGIYSMGVIVVLYIQSAVHHFRISNARFWTVKFGPRLLWF